MVYFDHLNDWLVIYTIWLKSNKNFCQRNGEENIIQTMVRDYHKLKIEPESKCSKRKQKGNKKEKYLSTSCTIFFLCFFLFIQNNFFLLSFVSSFQNLVIFFFLPFLPFFLSSFSVKALR